MAAAYGGGGAGMVGAAAFAVLASQAKVARRTIGRPTAPPPTADGVYDALTGVDVSHEVGAEAEASTDEIRLAMLGDSTAAGLGVHRAAETPAAQLAGGLSEVSGRPVRVISAARKGARSQDLERQVSVAIQGRPHIAVIMVGSNDVTARVRPSTSVRLLEEAVRRLRAEGVKVIVGTCPDLGTIEPIAQPLREVARRWSRHLAAAQTIAVVEAGGTTVSLGDILSPEFAKRPAVLFGPDRFHPSAAGYREAARALLPTVCAVLGYWPVVGHEEAPDVTRGEGLRSVVDAAVEAANNAGTEVAGAQVAGHERGARGRWALLRYRRRQPLPDAATLARKTASAATSSDTATDAGGRVAGVAASQSSEQS